MIGMEIHVELATRSKMFSRSPNVAHPDFYDAPPNTLLDPVVVALPGALPVMNERAVEMAATVGLALECTIASFSRWDRKNYFYPDLPKGYQISQYDQPLCADGAFEFDGADGETVRVGIIRAHLEEDAGKLSHELPGGQPYDGTLVDLNRAGTPLLEIVTHPDLTSADDAATFARELRNLCRFLSVTGGVMQRGHMRFEPNINVIIQTDDGQEHATPIVEIKNLNSFRALRDSIEYEHARQIDLWRADGVVAAPGLKSTRGWDDARNVTILQREKEESHDYRYFPDPDLVPVTMSDERKSEIASRLPELPRRRRARYVQNYDLSLTEAWALTEDRPVSDFFEACAQAFPVSPVASDDRRHAGRACAKLLLNSAAKRANENNCRLDELGVAPRQVAQIVALREADTIGSSAADELFALLMKTDDDAETTAHRHGLIQVSDAGQLEAWVAEAIEAQAQAAQDYRDGKDAAIGRLLGAVMKISGGTADAKAVRDQLQRRLRPS